MAALGPYQIPNVHVVARTVYTNNTPSGAFRCDDAQINIAANKQEQFVTLCGLIGRPDLAEDPRFGAVTARLWAYLRPESLRALGQQAPAPSDTLRSAAE